MDILCQAFASHPHPQILSEMAVVADRSKDSARAIALRNRALELAGATTPSLWVPGDEDSIALSQGGDPGASHRRFFTGISMISDLRTRTPRYAMDVAGAVLSPDESIAAGIRRPGRGDQEVPELRVRDAMLGESLTSIQGSDRSGVVAFALLPDDEVVVALRGGGLEVWDLATNRLVKRMEDKVVWTQLHMSGVGPVVLLAGQRGSHSLIAAIDVRARRALWERPVGEPALALAARPDGKRLVSIHKATNGANASIQVLFWDAATGQQLTKIPALQSSSCPDYTWAPPLIYGPSGKLVVNCGREVIALNEAGAELWRKQSTSYAERIAFSADGLRVLRQDELTIEKLDAITGAVSDTTREYLGGVNVAVLTPSGRELAVGVEDTVVVVPLGSGIPYVASRHAAKVGAVFASTRGQIFSVAENGEAIVHDLATKRGRALPIKALGKVAVSPDGRRIAVEDGDEISVRAIDDGKQLARWPFSAGDQLLEALLFSGDGDLAVSTRPKDSYDGRNERFATVIRDPAISDPTRGAKRSFPGTVLAFSPDRRLVVAKEPMRRGWDEEEEYEGEVLVVRDLSSGATRTLMLADLGDVAFSADGARLIISNHAESILWDLERNLVTSGAPVWPISILANGMVVGTQNRTGADYALKFFAPAAIETPLLSLQLSHTGEWLALSQDGSYEASQGATVLMSSGVELLPPATPAAPGDGTLFKRVTQSPPITPAAANAGSGALPDDTLVMLGPTPASPTRLLDELRALPVERRGDRRKAKALHLKALASLARAKATGQARDFAAAEQLWAAAARTDPNWDWPFYNLACVAALTGRPTDALAYLREVRGRVPTAEMVQRIERDPDFAALRGGPELPWLIKFMKMDLEANADSAAP